jgi:DNA-binding LacI/PurR family transcriptional regulator
VEWSRPPPASSNLSARHQGEKGSARLPTLAPTPQKRPPSLMDVAKRAGVSHQTVSRVLNNHARVAASTRQRVQAAIDELGYRRNEAARALVTRRSSIIGVIISGEAYSGPSGILTAVERAGRDAGYYVSVASLSNIQPTAVQEALGHFASQGVEGVIVIAPEAAIAHMSEPFAATSAPVVLVAAGASPASGVQIASVDQEHGARLATRHLIDLGHRRIGHIAGPQPWFDAIERMRGWRQELRESGLRAGPVVTGDWSAESGAGAARKLLRGKLPTAVFASNDRMALGAVRAFHDAGLSVPHDVSVVGFDDMAGTAFLIPGLTTVRQDLQALGTRCIEMLLHTLAGQVSEWAAIEPELVIRDSTRTV